MRKYQPIWEQIKRDKTAIIVAPVDTHAYLIRQVVKEKHRDAGFRLLQSEVGKKLKLRITTDKKKSTITFKLTSATYKDIDLWNL